MKRKRTSTSSSLVKKAKAIVKKQSVPRNWFGASALTNNRTGFPNRMRVTHRYCESVFRTAAAGAIANYNFSFNGMFDPNTTGTGHQPTYFDKMSSIYNHYTVLSSKVSGIICPMTTSTALVGQAALVQLDTNSFSFSNIDNVREQPRVAWTALNFKNVDASNGNPNRLSLTWNAFKMFGSRALSDPDLRGTSSANPNEQSYGSFCVQDANLAAAADVNFIVTIEYVAEWTELRQELSN